MNTPWYAVLKGALLITILLALLSGCNRAGSMPVMSPAPELRTISFFGPISTPFSSVAAFIWILKVFPIAAKLYENWRKEKRTVLSTLRNLAEFAKSILSDTAAFVTLAAVSVAIQVGDDYGDVLEGVSKTVNRVNDSVYSVSESVYQIRQDVTITKENQNDAFVKLMSRIEGITDRVEQIESALSLYDYDPILRDQSRPGGPVGPRPVTRGNVSGEDGP